MKKYTLEWMNHRLELGERTCIMGILNVTPDSFSDGGRFFTPEAAVARAVTMVRDGANIIDIGGESTRPFSEPVSPEEEARRVLPVIRMLASKINIPISIDTTKAEIARQAIEAGASVINDISSLGDPEMAQTAVRYDVPVVMMHMKGTPGTMQMAPQYEHLLGDVRAFFENAVERAVSAGISRNRLILDPGIGFGKTVTHNLCLLRRLDAFVDFDLPVLVGSSRKTFIRHILKKDGEKDMDPMQADVETGTQATVAASIMAGAHIVRVHNVGSTRATVRLIDAIRNAPDNP